MRRTSFDTWPCSIARTADILGDAWTLLVLREVFYGESRFDGFIGSLGIARNTLTDRLRRLESEGLLRRRAYQTDPVRHEYLLTERAATSSASSPRSTPGATAGWPATRAPRSSARHRPATTTPRPGSSAPPAASPCATRT
ncbi:hypothetical protein SPURM210S_06014 [Streptomyces purpurascens]